MNRFDAIMIGAGQAGPTLASRLASAGMQVAVVERQRFGGSCVNTGCTPTKALVASAHAAWMARRASEYGVDTEGVRVDMPRVKDRKDQIVAKSREGLEKWLREEIDGVTVFDGHARFVGPRRVEVGGAILSADLLDGGSRRVSERILTYGLFIDPPLGRVGQTEAQVRESGRPALVGKRPMTRVSRAVEKGDTRGFMKVLVDAETKRPLGAAILGVGGG